MATENVSITVADEITSPSSEDSCSAFHWHFLLDILSPKKLFVPMNWKRVFVWAITACTIALLALPYAYPGSTTFNIIESFDAFLAEDLLFILLFVYGLEPLITFSNMAFCAYPQSPTPETSPNAALINGLHPREDIIAWRHQKNAGVAVVIPCHNSCKTPKGKQELIAAIKSALIHIPARNIFIADNGTPQHPTDATCEVVKSIAEDINYFYYPYAGKTAATYRAIQYIDGYRNDLTFLLSIDDDVCIPKNFQVRSELFESPDTLGVAYPVRAIGKDNLITKWQDLEYKLSDTAFGSKAFFNALDKTHGAVLGLCLGDGKIKNVLQLYANHDGVFRGEDWKIGYGTAMLYHAKSCYTLAFDAACPFETTVPTSYMGKLPNLFTQRVRSWYPTRYLSPSLVLGAIFLTWRRPTLSSLVYLKLHQAYELLSAISNPLRPLVIALQAGNPKFWIILGAIEGANLLTNLAFNHIKLPSNLRSDLLTVLSFPLYKKVDLLFDLLSILRVWFVELPIKKPSPPLRVLEASGKLPELNIDLWFPRNPAEFLESDNSSLALSDAQPALVYRYQKTAFRAPSATDEMPSTKVTPQRNACTLGSYV